MPATMELKRDFALGKCVVLIVDDDADTLDEYGEIAESLGYDCLMVGDVYSALKLIAEDPQIGIVITDLMMPAIDGISFLEEISSRFSNSRPILSIVITGAGSFEAVVEAMRLNARDFLQKPVTKESFAAVLRRASRTWKEIAYGFYFGQQEAVISALSLMPGEFERADSAQLGDSELLAMVKSMVRKRERRGDFLDKELFSDPRWDLLLDLTSAKLEGVAVPVSSACAATHLPLSTALRYLRTLTDAGMVRRWHDPHDRRRDLLELEETTMEAMRSYFSVVKP